MITILTFCNLISFVLTFILLVSHSLAFYRTILCIFKIILLNLTFPTFFSTLLTLFLTFHPFSENIFENFRSFCIFDIIFDIEGFNSFDIIFDIFNIIFDRCGIICDTFYTFLTFMRQSKVLLRSTITIIDGLIFKFS